VHSKPFRGNLLTSLFCLSAHFPLKTLESCLLSEEILYALLEKTSYRGVNPIASNGVGVVADGVNIFVVRYSRPRQGSPLGLEGDFSASL
jgi:hypothetical protein